MAESKKFLDVIGLQKYDTKIKEHIDSKDAATLAASKSYSDSKDSMFEPAGAATTAKNQAVEAAKAYTDGKVGEVNGTIAEVKKTADKGVADAATAKQAADAAAAKATSVATLVGTLPEDTEATTVVDYINKRTEDIPSDAVVKELQTKVGQHDTDINGLKTRMQTAEGNIGKLQGETAANKSAIGVLNGTGEGSVKKQVDDALNAFATNVSNDGVVNTFKELVDYCATHGSEAAEMAGNIEKNKQAIAKLETFVGKLPEGTKATDVIAYINEKVAAEQSRAQGAESALSGRVGALEGKLGDGEGSVSAQIEAAKQAAISAAAADAQKKADAAKGAAITEANKHSDAEVGKVKTSVDALSGKVTAVEGKVTTLEGKAHTHANKEVLDTVTAQKVANWDAAAGAKHSHANKADLDKITAAKINAWDAAEANAKTHATNLFNQFQPITTSEIDALFAKA